MLNPGMDDNQQKARKNVMLAVVHGLLALAILAGFFYMQIRR